MSVVIRPYHDSDLPALRAITVEAFEPVSIERNIESYFGEIAGHDWRWRKARQVDQDVTRDPSGTFVAESDNNIVGYVTTWIDYDAGVGFIPNLAVDARMRGHGIGRALLQRALRRFREEGIEYARIETLEQNPVGQSLYPSLGFKEVARQIHYCMKISEELDETKKNGQIN